MVECFRFILAQCRFFVSLLLPLCLFFLIYVVGGAALAAYAKGPSGPAAGTTSTYTVTGTPPTHTMSPTPTITPTPTNTVYSTPTSTSTNGPTFTHTSTSTPRPTDTPSVTPVTLPYCWQPVMAPDIGHNWINGSMQAVSALASNDVWALVSYQDYQGTRYTAGAWWDGITWNIHTIRSLASGEDMTALVAISDNNVWAVGHFHEGGVIMHWDGSQWSVSYTLHPAPPPHMYTGATITAIDASGPNNVWAVGYSSEGYSFEGGPESDEGIVIRWDGAHWSTVGDFNTVFLNTVAVTSPNSVWVAGGVQTQNYYDPWLMHWDGTNWTLSGFCCRDGSITSVAAISPTDVWASTDGYGGMHFVHFDGSQWTPVSSQDLWVSQIEPVSSNDIWAATGTSAGSAGTLLHWNGSYWGRVPVEWGNVTGLSALSSSNIWAVGNAPSTMLVLHYTSSCIPTPVPSPTATHSPTTPTVTPTLQPPPCAGERFPDVCPHDYFYPYVQALANDGILYGYASVPPCPNALWMPCFLPYASTTRGQISKIVSLAAGFNEPVTNQTFEDVPPGSTYYTYTERMASRNIITGYPCGGPGEPCVPPADRPYFRTNNNVTRGQLSKMTSLAFGWVEPVTGQQFEDVAPGSTFYDYIGRLYNRAVINGYPCGGPGEPCVPPGNRPYFRPNNNVIRGQTAKIVQLSRTQPTPTPPVTFTPTITPVTTPTATQSAAIPSPSDIPTATVTPINSPTSTTTPGTTSL